MNFYYYNIIITVFTVIDNDGGWGAGGAAGLRSKLQDRNGAAGVCAGWQMVI